MIIINESLQMRINISVKYNTVINMCPSPQGVIVKLNRLQNDKTDF